MPSSKVIFKFRVYFYLAYDNPYAGLKNWTIDSVKRLSYLLNVEYILLWNLLKAGDSSHDGSAQDNYKVLSTMHILCIYTVMHRESLKYS